jgi:hypothetical protein
VTRVSLRCRSAYLANAGTRDAPDRLPGFNREDKLRVGERRHQPLVKVEQPLFVLAQKFRFDEVGDEGGEGRSFRQLRPY